MQWKAEHAANRHGFHDERCAFPPWLIGNGTAPSVLLKCSRDFLAYQLKLVPKLHLVQFCRSWGKPHCSQVFSLSQLHIYVRPRT